MTIDSSQLLRKLEPAVRPPIAPSAAGRAQAPLERQGFDELLALVSRGAVHSGRAVMIGPAAELSEELDERQMERLAAAADLAEASGAGRAVMLIDGRGLIMDVPGRQITDELTAPGMTRLIDIDAAVHVAGDDEDEAIAGAPGMPGADLIPPAVARQLEELQRTPPPSGGA